MRNARRADRARPRWIRTVLLTCLLSSLAVEAGWGNNGLARGAPLDSQSPGNPTLEAQIEAALEKGDADSARSLLPRFLAEPRLSSDALLRTGIAVAQREMFPEAVQVFKRCVDTYPGLFEGYYNLALAEFATREYSSALAVLEKAPHTSPNQEVARTYLRGKIELARGENAPGRHDLAAAFADAPQEENYGIDLGLAYVRARMYRPAAAVFEKASRYHPDSAFLLLGLGLAEFLGGQNSESIKTCRTALHFHPDFSPVRVLLAFALNMQGDAQAAAQVASEGLHYPAPIPYLYYIHAAALLKLQSKEYDSILKELALAEQSIPNCTLCYLAQSTAQQRMGQIAAAVADLEKAVKLDSAYPEAWYRLAALYDREGHHPEAQQARRRFEALKENKANRENEMLRDVFVQAVGGESSE